MHQPCTYKAQTDNFRQFRVSEPTDDSTENRLRRLEGNYGRISQLEAKIDQLLGNSRPEHSAIEISISNGQTPEPQLRHNARSLGSDDDAFDEQSAVFEAEPGINPAPSEAARPPPQVLQHVVDLYYELCENQPLPLLAREDDPVQFSDLTTFGIIAVAARYSNHVFFRHELSSAQAFNRKARRVIFSTLESCETKLSTIQAICLITLADYLDGSVQRANLTLGIGIRLAYSMGLLRPRTLDYVSDEDDVCRCCWSLFTMERLFSLGSGTFVPLIDENDLPRYPSSPELPPHVIPAVATAGQTPVDLGIIACYLPLVAVWGKIMKYIQRNKLSGDSQLPWMADSSYNQIVSQMLHSEAVCPNHHRWEMVRFPQQKPECLQSSRAYWGPWLLMQFLHHSCLALLNHPVFFLGETPTTFSQLPPSFAQSVSTQAQVHSRWIAHFAHLLREKDLKAVDPFMAYGASIAATIHAFYAAAQNQEVSQRARKDFVICAQLVAEMSTTSPSLQNLVGKLQRLQQESQVHGPATAHPALSQESYAEIVWNVLEYTKPSEGSLETQASQPNASVEASVDLLQPDHADGQQRQFATDALVSSLGILAPFSCPDFAQSSVDEWSIGNL